MLCLSQLFGLIWLKFPEGPTTAPIDYTRCLNSMCLFVCVWICVTGCWWSFWNSMNIVLLDTGMVSQKHWLKNRWCMMFIWCTYCGLNDRPFYIFYLKGVWIWRWSLPESRFWGRGETGSLIDLKPYLKDQLVSFSALTLLVWSYDL